MINLWTKSDFLHLYFHHMQIKTGICNIHIYVIFEEAGLWHSIKCTDGKTVKQYAHRNNAMALHQMFESVNHVKSMD